MKNEIKPIEYPSEAGMPLGGPDFVPFLMVEIHYNNEQAVAGLRDSSGLRVTYTDTLRPNDAGIMELGLVHISVLLSIHSNHSLAISRLIYSDVNSIPPGQSAFPITAFCPSECTQKAFQSVSSSPLSFLLNSIHVQFPRSGIRIFASQLHAHLTGRKLHTSLIRNGKKVAEVNRDNHYSPHWQHIQALSPHVHVLQVGHNMDNKSKLVCSNHQMKIFSKLSLSDQYTVLSNINSNFLKCFFDLGRCVGHQLCVRHSGTV